MMNGSFERAQRAYDNMLPPEYWDDEFEDYEDDENVDSWDDGYSGILGEG